MPFRTILTVTGVRQGNDDLALAADLSGQAGAHLSVLVVALAAPPAIGRYAAAFSTSWTKERQADVRGLDRRVAEVKRFLAEKSVPAELAGEYLETAWAAESIGRRARCSDLVLLGPASLAGEGLGSRVIEGALFSSARPILLVPPDCRPTLAPRRVLIGWDGSIEAARAVREAREMLIAASGVTVALVDAVSGEAGHGEEPGADLAAYLARHGVNVVVDRLPGEGLPVADILRRHAVDTSADMLVLGAYGHSRLREFVLGGVTRSVLDRSPVPVFMAR
jgi:nucleotide-binding universal stress UspA family protein